MPRKELVRKDIVIAIAAVLLIAAVTFGLAKVRPDLPPTPSSPAAARGSSEAAKKSGKVIMRVNGDPITEAEFEAFMSAVPEQQRAMFAGPAGKRELAKELVRMKTLEQEAKRRGLDKDPELRSQLDLLTTQLTATRALQDMVEEKSEKQIQTLYEKEKGSSLSLRHIVVAYEGGMIPPKGEGRPPSGDEAMRKANVLVERLRGGADFAATARSDSDDQESGQRGGSLGPLRAEMLPPDVAGVVTKLKPGQISDPVKTQFGVHVFSVGQPTLEDMRPMLQQRVQNQIAQEEVQRLQNAAKVDLDPQFFPPAPVVPTPGPQTQTAPQAAPRGRG
ncbi:MAG: peptidylprolyl isomerase [Thermoanaerobaculia bacterium]